MSDRKTAVAIDGPAGAGKSTVARRVAGEMGYIYVDTGALYRTVAYSVLTNGIAPSDAAAVAKHLENIKVDIRYIDGEQRVMLNGNDVSGLIRTPEVSEASSVVSAHSAVRKYLLGLQRRLAAENDVVMDGRDIATVVLPDANVKIFLTASAEVRAKRRFDELTAKGISENFDDVLADIKERDRRDMNRPVAPLKASDDAEILDTSGMTLEEVVSSMRAIIESKLRENG